MLTEKDLINGEINASDDTDGMNHLIQNLYNEIARKRTKAIRLTAEGRQSDAIDLQKIADEMSSELDKLIKQHTNYMKYLKAINKDKLPQQPGIAPDDIRKLKNQKSSNGDIVATVPKN